MTILLQQFRFTVRLGCTESHSASGTVSVDVLQPCGGMKGELPWGPGTAIPPLFVARMARIEP